MSNFKKELEELINKHSMENASNTPDFILASYMLDSLIAFDCAMQRREQWYEKDKVDGYNVVFTHEMGVKIPTYGELILDNNE